MLPLVLAAGALALPEPAMPAPREIAERGESPVYYRAPDDTFLPSGRFDLGTATRLPGGGTTEKSALALDLLAGAALATARGSRIAALGELGYSYVGFSEHYFTAGVGALLRVNGPIFGDDRSLGDKLWVAVVPRGLLGASDGDLAVGLRTAATIGWEGWGLELAHQLVSKDSGTTQEIHVALVVYALYPVRYP